MRSNSALLTDAVQHTGSRLGADMDGRVTFVESVGIVSRPMVRAISALPLIICAVADASEYSLACSYVDNRPTAEMESHAECATRVSGALRVSEDHLARMSYFNGLASVVIDGHWYYVMRNGHALLVLTYDNGPDDFSEGLTRSPVGGKVAYFDSAFQQVIGPKYDWGWPFEGGRALVCIGCKPGKPDNEGHSFLSGGLWGYIDRNGNEVVPVKLSQEEVQTR